MRLTAQQLNFLYTQSIQEKPQTVECYTQSIFLSIACTKTIAKHWDKKNINTLTPNHLGAALYKALDVKLKLRPKHQYPFQNFSPKCPAIYLFN